MYECDVCVVCVYVVCINCVCVICVYVCGVHEFVWCMCVIGECVYECVCCVYVVYMCMVCINVARLASGDPETSGARAPSCQILGGSLAHTLEL